MRIKCPECGTELEVPDNHPVRPFCSTRCKLLDLGRWFNEEHRIPLQPSEPPPDAPERRAPEPSSVRTRAVLSPNEAPPALTVDLDRFKIPDA
ncbi:MAG TPA: DNA gyrase inhibitor YacG [Polyangiaceae bacterium]|nr:DNA gyrase inhibitor YacG [Polyangiaceae bacterium]